MPVPPRAAISTDDEVSPAAPMSWMPTSASGRHQLEARLEQQLLHERIADLHRRALGLRLLVELGARPWSRRGCRRGRSWRRRRGPGCRRRCAVPRKIAVGARDAERERVDQDVAVVAAGRTARLAADGGHADAVAVAADAGTTPVEQVARARGVGRAEAQRVERARSAARPW